MKSELLVTGMLFVLLFFKLRQKDEEKDNGEGLMFVNLMLVVNVVAGFFMNSSGTLFGDMFRTDPMIAMEKNILNLGVLLVSLQAFEWLRNHRHALEFYMLLLSTLLGMFFMISTDNLMMFYLGLELATIPLAAMVNFDLDRKTSSEAALKMIMLSAFSSALLLFGISMFYGTTGTLSLKEIPMLLSGDPLQVFSLVLLVAGFGFKISAVPFHFWTADVYEGAPATVTAYLSVVSKGAILFAMVPVLYHAFEPMSPEWYRMLVLIAVATMVIGNLFAVRQYNMKRLLAFSSIAQVGFILVGMTGQTIEAHSSVIYFILVYVFSNLGAFGVITLVSALTGKETIDDYKGFYKTNPLLSWVMALSLFSLAGIPPTAGFFGKFFLLIAGAGTGNYLLIAIASLNMIVSLYYYLRVVRAIFMESNTDPIPTLKSGLMPGAAFVICVAGMIVAGLYGGFYEYIFQLAMVF
jgi:NADH-quinone oxidoreductase subunit N